MIKYTNYMFKYTFKKKPIWIMGIFSIASIILITWLMIKEVNKYSISFVTSVNSFSKIFPFLLGISFMTMIIVYVFKEGEEDGSELMIVSKPISRFHILFGKFFVVLVSILIFNFFLFFTQLAASQFDKFGTIINSIRYSGSITIGSMITMTIGSFILIFIASFLGKMGTISIGVATAAILPTASQIVSKISLGQPNLGVSYESSVHLLNQRNIENLINKEIIEATNNNFKLNFPDLISIEKTTLQPVEWRKIEKYNSYVQKRWYDSAVYFDIWNQWSEFYNLTSPTAIFDIGAPLKLTLSERKINIDNNFAMEKINGKNVAIPINILTVKDFSLENVMNTILKILLGKAKVKIITKNDYGRLYDLSKKKILPIDWPEVNVLDLFTNYKVKRKWASGEEDVINVSFEDRIRAIKKSLYNHSSPRWLTVEQYCAYKFITSILNAGNEIDKYIDSISIATKKSITKESIKLLSSPFKISSPKHIYGFSDSESYEKFKQDKTKISSTTENFINDIDKIWKDNITVGIGIDNKEMLVLNASPFISKRHVIIIWVVLGFIMFLVTVLRYWKRDFK